MRLTLDMAKKMFEMREQGIKIEAIAEELGVSGQTVRNRLKGERPPEKDTVHSPLEPTNQMTASEYREHVLKQRAAEAEQAKPADPAEEPKPGWKSVKLPRLIAVVKRVEYTGRVGNYSEEDGAITIRTNDTYTDNVIAKGDLLDFIDELTELAKRVGAKRETEAAE